MSAPVYVPLANIAGACGITEHVLLTQHWPAHWGVPKDWQMVPRSSTVIVNERALPDLVAALREAKLDEAAARLDTWRAEIGAPEPHEDFMARHSAPPRKPAEPWFKQGQFE